MITGAGNDMTDASQPGPRRAVLNVGGNNRDIGIPPRYNGWDHRLLDIDPTGKPDICCDAREISQHVAAASYDAVYCSHNLEHYYAHDVPKVLAGFHHILKPDGFAEIRVPDLIALMHTVVEKKLDVLDVLYQSPAGPVTVRDVIYGYGPIIAQSGQDFYAHKTGFGPNSLIRALTDAGLPFIGTTRANLEIRAFAFKQRPSEERLIELGISKPKHPAA